MRYQSALLYLFTIHYASAAEPQGADKVILNSVKDGKSSTLTFYSVHVPVWLSPDPRLPSSDQCRAIADLAGIPKDNVDPDVKPDSVKVTFPSILLHRARVRYTKDHQRIKISCKAANGRTIVSYKVPSQTKISEISTLFTSRLAGPKEGTDVFPVEVMKVPADKSKASLATTVTLLDDAWLGMQDFCTMLIKYRQLFLNKLRDKMVDAVDSRIMTEITKDLSKEFSGAASVSESGPDVTSATTSAKILNIGDGEARNKIESELDKVIKKGRCLGESYRIDEKVLEAQEPVVAVVDTAVSDQSIKIKCFSFFEGKIVPVIEISEPKDTEKCESIASGNTPDEIQSGLSRFFSAIYRGLNNIVSGTSTDAVNFKVIRKTSTDATAEDTTAIKEEDPKIKTLCQRLTQDYLLIVRDEPITCTDCLFKYNDLQLNPQGVVAGVSPAVQSAEIAIESNDDSNTPHSGA